MDLNISVGARPARWVKLALEADLRETSSGSLIGCVPRDRGG